MKNQFIIRIYDVGTNEPPYVNYGEDTESYKPVVTVVTNASELLAEFEKVAETHEGWGYTVYDIASNICVVGGALDPSDRDIIKEYIS